MPEIDEYLKLAASKFKQAEEHLEDAEYSLHTLAERLDNCLKLIRQIPHDELLFLLEQQDGFVPENRPVKTKELHPVSS